MQTNNPAFTMPQGDIFADWASADRRSQVMTVQGTALKATALLAILTAAAGFAWYQVGDQGASPLPYLIGGLIGGLVFFFATIFKPRWAPITAPLYAACEGLLLGPLSYMFNARYQGIVTQAVSLTFGVTFVMLFLYGARIIRVTDRLVMGIVAATGGVALVYLAAMLLRLFGVQMPFIYDATPIGIGFSVFVVGLAAFNLLLDFDFIERGATQQAPKYMEWYGAFGLMVTLIWLYMEVLRLLRKIQDSRR